MSRQTTRQHMRELAKAERTEAKLFLRRIARQELKERQSRRELDGSYTGLAVALCIAPSRSRIASRKVQKGKAFGRILRITVEDGREFAFHATKGMREHRV